ADRHQPGGHRLPGPLLSGGHCHPVVHRPGEGESRGGSGIGGIRGSFPGGEVISSPFPGQITPPPGCRRPGGSASGHIRFSPAPVPTPPRPAPPCRANGRSCRIGKSKGRPSGVCCGNENRQPVRFPPPGPLHGGDPKGPLLSHRRRNASFGSSVRRPGTNRRNTALRYSDCAGSPRPASVGHRRLRDREKNRSLPPHTGPQTTPPSPPKKRRSLPVRPTGHPGSVSPRKGKDRRTVPDPARCSRSGLPTGREGVSPAEAIFRKKSI